MKHVLSLLMVFVLMQVEARALSGGPAFLDGTSNSQTAVGTFAGVLLPKGDTSTSGATTSNSNSLGVFSLSSPSTGLATGTFSYFDSGATYVGTITGVIDPEKLRLRALVKAQYTVEITETGADNLGDQANFVFSFANGFANGSIDARLENDGNFVGGTLAVRIKGDATLDVQGADPTTESPSGSVFSLALEVDGFKQSDTVNGAVDLTSLLDQTLANGGTSSTTTGTTATQ